MATDTLVGFIEKEEDFLVTAIADLPEIDILGVTGSTIAVVAVGDGGRLRLDIAATDDDDVGAVSFGALNWKAGAGPLFMEARFLLSSIADNKYFVGFGDSIATTDETSFSATTDSVTIDTMSDAIGFLFDGDATTLALWCVAGATDSVTVNKVLSTKYNPVAATMLTLGVWLSTDRKSAVWYVNGEEVYRVDASASVLVGAVALVPGVWAYEQGTAFNLDVDRLKGRMGRGT